MPADRFRNLKNQYDLIIIGGGIHGAAMIWEAASRGLTAILLEKNDYGSATSANSLKIIHGGMRYLQDLDFIRMRQSIKERKALLRIAPHLVSPLECVMPTYKELGKSKLALKVGMKLYEAVAYDRNHSVNPARHIKSGEILSLEELNIIVPGLSDENITGGARWYDAQVYNSERLVLSFIMSARQRGAHTFNYAEVNNPIIEKNRISGVHVEDKISGNQKEISANAVIDCTGPWVTHNPLFNQVSKSEHKGKFAKAANIIIDSRIADCAVGLKFLIDTDHGKTSRLMFIVPWREGSMIGTWYFIDDNKPGECHVSDEQLHNCIKQVNKACPGLHLKKESITNLHVGLLPMEGVNQYGEPVLCKKDLICHAGDQGGISGLYWVQGVKYTTARGIAEQTIDLISDSIPISATDSKTDCIPLYGGEVSDIERFTKDCIQRYSGRYSKDTIVRLIKNYGSNIENIIALADQDKNLSEKIPGVPDSVAAELQYVIEHEQVHTLSDLLLRRTDIASFSKPSEEAVNYCIGLMANYYSWGQTEKHKNIEIFTKLY